MIIMMSSLVYNIYSDIILILVGEPLNDKAWLWYHNVVGEERCTVVDTWWQTGNTIYTLFN